MIKRTFGQRLFIVLWILWALLFAGISAAVINDSIRYTEGWRVLGKEQHPLPDALAANENVMQAYYGSMTKQEKRDFESAVRAGRVIIPERHNMFGRSGYEIKWESIGGVTASAAIAYVLGCLLQFLFLGYGSPLRLLRSRSP